MNTRVGYLGPDGTFTSQAARALCQDNQILIPLGSTRELENEFTDGNIHAMVVPIENSLAGTVIPSQEMISRLGNLASVKNEHTLFVTFVLFRKPNDTNDLAKIYSHHKALAQCDRFIRQLCANPIDTDSSAGACKLVSESTELGIGAIAPPGAGEQFGLITIQTKIENQSGASTRFLFIERNP